MHLHDLSFTKDGVLPSGCTLHSLNQSINKSIKQSNPVKPTHGQYLLLGPELVEHLLDLHLPVVLQRVEGRGDHLEESRLLDGRQLVQDAGEGGPAVGVRAPALCGEKASTLLPCRGVIGLLPQQSRSLKHLNTWQTLLSKVTYKEYIC